MLPSDDISTLVTNDIDEDLEQPGFPVCVRLTVAEDFPSPKVGRLDRA
jgi:hypothetical protein